MKSVEDQKQELAKRLKKRTAFTMALYILIFGIPAVLAAFIGNAIDEYFQIKPMGSIFFLFLPYLVAWFVAFRTYKFMTRIGINVDIKNNENE